MLKHPLCQAGAFNKDQRLKAEFDPGIEGRGTLLVRARTLSDAR